MKNSLQAIENTPNPTLVMTIILKDLNEVIIPGIKEVINVGFDLKAQTNSIYLEGVEHVNLLTQEEVISIIKDPRAILDGEKEEESSDNGEKVIEGESIVSLDELTETEKLNQVQTTENDEQPEKIESVPEE